MDKLYILYIIISYNFLIIYKMYKAKYLEYKQKYLNLKYEISQNAGVNSFMENQYISPEARRVNQESFNQMNEWARQRAFEEQRSETPYQRSEREAQQQREAQRQRDLDENRRRDQEYQARLRANYYQQNPSAIPFYTPAQRTPEEVQFYNNVDESRQRDLEEQRRLRERQRQIDLAQDAQRRVYPQQSEQERYEAERQRRIASDRV